MPTTTIPSLYKLPVLWFKFNIGDISGTTIKNYGTLNENGTLDGNATITTTTYKYGNGSLSLDGGSYVLVPNVTLTTNGFSVCSWFNFSSTGWYRLFDFGISGVQSNSYGYSPGEGLFSFSDNSLWMPSGATKDKATSTWQHMVVSFTYASANNASSVVNFYINGSKVGTYTNAYYPSISDVRNASYIGKSNDGGSYYPTGYINDFRFYDYIVTDTQASDIYAGKN
jgi:hypothetical protein